MDLFKPCFQESKQKQEKQSKRRFRAAKQLPSDVETVHKSLLINLGEDVCTEIFLFLPVKSILKFKTLSKSWLSILSSKWFRQNHASRHHRAAPVGLFYPIEYYFYYGCLLFDDIHSPIKQKFEYTMPFLEQPGDYKGMRLTCMSSCNGLQLFRIPKRNSPDHMYHIYNPTTEESKALLDIPPHISENKFVCASLAFDPYESLNYKIIFLCREHELSHRYQIEVYSSATGICKASESNAFVGDFSYNHIHGIFCNGAIHWLSGDTIIVYFNVHTDRIKELQTPLLPRTIQYFGESQGHLHLVNSDHRYFYKSSVLDVYELKGDYSGWFLKYQVDLASIASALPQKMYPREDYGTFMSIFRHEEDDDSNIVLLVDGREWVEYNFKMKTTKRHYKHELREPCTSPFPWTYGFKTHQFIPTLTCL